MGHVIRLSESFTGQNLVKLSGVNAKLIRDQLLRMPTIRAFFDFTDTTTMELVDGEIAKIDDLSHNKFTFVQNNTAKMPTYSSDAFSGVGGAELDGSQFMESSALIGARSKQTLVMFIKISPQLQGNGFVFSSKTNQNYGSYVTTTGLRSFRADVRMDDVFATARPLHYIVAHDTDSATATIMIQDKTASGATRGEDFASDAYLGRWYDGASSESGFVGSIGHIMIFDEDVSKNPALLNLINEYALQKYN